jgi:hypothetical protein
MNKQTIHEIIEQEKQDLEDAKRIVMNIEKLESKDKPLVKKIRDRYPQLLEFMGMIDENEYEDLHDKLENYKSRIELLESNLEFDLNHSNIAEDIKRKRQVIKKLYEEYNTARTLYEFKF